MALCFTQEQVLIICRNTEVMYQIFLDHQTLFNALTRVRFTEARNKIHLILMEGVKDPDREEVTP